MIIYRLIYWMDKKGMFNLFKVMSDHLVLLYVLLSVYFAYWIFFVDLIGELAFASPTLAAFWPFILIFIYRHDIVLFLIMVSPLFLLPILVNIDRFKEVNFTMKIVNYGDFEMFIHKNLALILLDIYVIFGVISHAILLYLGKLKTSGLIEGILETIFAGIFWPFVDIEFITATSTGIAIPLTILILTPFYRNFYNRQFSLRVMYPHLK